VSSQELAGESEREVLRAKRIVVKADRMVCSLQITDPRWHYSSPELIGLLLPHAPNLARHSCVNERGEVFGAVMNDTPLAHVFEHLTVELLSAAASDPKQIYKGLTWWDDQSRGLASVEISYTDDIETFKVIRQALHYINEAIDRLEGRA